MRRQLAERDHDGFLDSLIAQKQKGAMHANDDYLGALGGEGLCLLLESASPPPNILALGECYAEMLLSKAIVAPKETIDRLASILASDALVELSKTIGKQQARLTGHAINHASGNTNTTVLQVRRVAHIMKMVMGDGRYSDASGICRSIFRSEQERTFHRALSLRFPGLIALPNYPLDQIVDLDRVEGIGNDLARYGRLCRLDAVLVVPDEGDPVAAFELDSRQHDHLRDSRRDEKKNKLMAASGLQFFRLRVESPESISVDEWYALLSDEVLPQFELGNRIRSRQTAYSLIPC